VRELLRYRTMAAVCREKMALYPKDKRRWEIEALQWDMRALDLIAFHFRESKVHRSDNRVSSSADGSRRDPIVGAF
jgi:hypothetical protein